MNHQQIVERLSTNSDVFKHLLQGVPEDQARWKPAADRWSLLEVVNHLYDEEFEDFGKRIELVLSDPARPWPPIDPEGWVVQRRYNERNFRESLSNFLTAREASLVWLNEQTAADWEAIHHHPSMGPMSAELLLANWLAHDLFHIRQIAELQFAGLSKQVAPISLEYSGWE
jgi:hypothetical protein